MLRFLFSLIFAAALRAQTPNTSGPDDAYAKLITKEAVTHKGLFIVHQIADRFYYEIPKSELGREFLWNTRISGTTLGVGFAGTLMADRVMRWQLSGKKVYLRDVNYQVAADPRLPVAAAVAASNTETIVMAFDVAATGPDDAPTIEVTRLFNSDVPEFNIRQRLGATYIDADRTFVDRISTFPENIEVEATQTWTRNDTPAPLPGQMQPGSATVVVHHSMVRLPELPMQPRLFDDRTGYFYVHRLDYGRDDPRGAEVRYICRRRLEKKDPSAAVSEPVKPIVYYIDSATPVKWRDYIRQAVESWQPAFEAAGFRNAIVVKIAPEPGEDPDFSPEDIRHSVIRWLPSTTENAFGPNVHDPRTGEILNADIEFHQSMLNLVRTWYITQVGPLDPRARKVPLPDDLTGELIRYVIAHEVGHTLGMEHNLKASSTYPADKVHDREWVHRMGFTPSIMDYNRFDYVAQPEDGIPVEELAARVGPYDRWTIHWGYAPIPDAATPEAERPALDKWAREQETVPWYRFVTLGAYGSEPGEMTESVGDDDSIKSSGLGLKNLRRVAKMLIPATAGDGNETYEDLAHLYNAMLGQWAMEMHHVAGIVAGVYAQTKHSGQAGRVFTPVPRERMQAAVAFLNANAFTTPDWAIDPEIVWRIEPAGTLNRVRNAQIAVLNNLLGSARFTRLAEMEAMDPKQAWSPAAFLAAVRRGVWSELDASGSVRVDAYRRNLQRAWLDIANLKVNRGVPAYAGPQVASGDERPFYRAELKSLRASVNAALPKAADAATRAHLEGALDQIANILSPKIPQPAAPGTPANLIGIAGTAMPAACWQDYSILPE